jgi:capsular polysaccharide biosynthesis protein/tetratricopeptide (TPR) repeat protein
LKLNQSELTYNLGYVLQKQGKLSAAISAYREAIQLSPGLTQARHALAILLGEQGRYQAAIDQFGQVIAQQPDAVRAYNNLACILVSQGQIESAIQAYRQAIELVPDWGIPYENLGKVLEADDPARAAASYRQAIALQPDLLSARYGLGRLMQQQGQLATSIEILNQLLALEPDYSAAHATLGLDYLALGQPASALAHFRQALWPQRPQISAFCDWAMTLQGSDELTLARQACGRFLAALLQPDRQPAARAKPPKRRTVLVMQAPGAQASVTQAPVAQAPVTQQLAQTYLKLGDLLLRYGGEAQIRQAEAYYQQALQLQPQVETYLKLGCCLVQQKRLNAAVMLYRLALADRPDARLNHSLDRILEQQRWPEALCHQQALTNGLGADADEPLTHNPPALAEAADLAAQRSACAGLNCPSCLQKLTERFERCYLGWGVYQVQGCRTRCRITAAPDQSVTEIRQGRAWMTPYQTPWMVANSTGVLTPDGLLLPDLCREYPGQLPDCLHQPLPTRLPQTEAAPIAGSVAVLTGLSGHNYFHWMVDILPRLDLLRQSVHLSEIDWFWINAPQAEFQQATLRALGIPSSKILPADQYPWIQAERLLAPVFPGSLGWVEPWALRFLRQQFLPLADAELPGHERIYISRRSAHHRRLLNEAAVLEVLEPLGFRVVELEQLSFAQQVSLFAQAKVILAPHGGGLTNIIFCAPETTVIEIFSPGYIRQYYWAMSHHLGLNHYFVTGAAPSCPPIHQLMYPSALIEDIWLDLNALNHALKEVGLIPP